MADAVDIDSRVPDHLREMFEPSSNAADVRGAATGTAVQSRFSRTYRPWIRSSGVVSIMQHKEVKIDGEESRDSFIPKEGYHVLCGSYLALEIPKMVVKDPNTCQIRLGGDLHACIDVATLKVGDAYRFHMSRVALDSGLLVPREMRDEYEECIRRKTGTWQSDLRNWSSAIEREEVPFPQMWPYSRSPYESIPLYTEVNVIHDYKFDLLVDNLFEMRVRKGKGEWKAVPFDHDLVEGPRKIKKPDLWGMFEMFEQEDLQHFSTEPVEKRWIDVLVQRHKNPVKGGQNLTETIKLGKELPVLAVGWAAIECGRNNITPETRYLTSGLEDPIANYEITFGTETRVPKKSPMHSKMQQFFRMRESPLTPGIGVHSFANRSIGAETPMFVLAGDSGIDLNLKLKGSKKTEYNVYVITQTVRSLIFKKPEEWDSKEVKKVRMRGEIERSNGRDDGVRSAYRSGEETSFFAQ